jgi:two-component system chemotaxis sensor kinase CheA
MSAAAAIRKALIEKYRHTTRDRLERVTQGALKLATPAQSRHTCEELMHELHTLKGEAKMMSFPDISSLAHLAEDVVQDLPGKPTEVCGLARETLLRTVDGIAALLADDESSNQAPETTQSPARTTLEARPETPTPAPVLTMQSRTPQIRIDVRKLDELTEIAGGIVVSQARFENALDEVLAVLRELGDLGVASHVATAIAALREGAFDNRSRVQSLEAQVRELRLLSLSSLFDVYPRAVHDIAREQQKDVRVDVRGSDVEIDKHVFEALGEPLLHLIRNAIDHGVECPVERRAIGKPGT